MPHTPVAARNRGKAKAMRHAMTEAELKLWNELRAHRLGGLGFRRQVPIAGYIVDFACPAGKLVVEVDDSQHREPEAARLDKLRAARLEADGWTVLRFWNDDILHHINDVCRHIVTAAGLMADDAVRQGQSHQEEAAL
jgi:very-short-patch-repair endonuclease